MDSKKRSQIVLLSLIGLPVAVGLAAELAPEGEQVRRNLYQDRAACERHYSPAQCEPRSGGVGGFHGPYYVADRSAPSARGDPGPGRGGPAFGHQGGSNRGRGGPAWSYMGQRQQGPARGFRSAVAAYRSGRGTPRAGEAPGG